MSSVLLEVRVARAHLRQLNLDALASPAGDRLALKLIDLQPAAAGPEAALLFGPIYATAGAPVHDLLEQHARAIARVRAHLEDLYVPVLAYRIVRTQRERVPV